MLNMFLVQKSAKLSQYVIYSDDFIMIVLNKASNNKIGMFKGIQRMVD